MSGLEVGITSTCKVIETNTSTTVNCFLDQSPLYFFFSTPELLARCHVICARWTAHVLTARHHHPRCGQEWHLDTGDLWTACIQMYQRTMAYQHSRSGELEARASWSIVHRHLACQEKRKAGKKYHRYGMGLESFVLAVDKKHGQSADGRASLSLHQFPVDYYRAAIRVNSQWKFQPSHLSCWTGVLSQWLES